jgi:MHS family proline/betaine transporter-like MFS transporter
MRAANKIILASVFGNALEFYDFTLYGVFAAIIANQYFPGSDDSSKLLYSLAAFAVGFFTRPIGAILFGHFGDRYGRKNALSLSVLLMGVPTFIISVSPNYHQIGIAASLLIFSCRLLQGVFTGGEYNGAAIFAIEHVGKKCPGFIGGLITGSCVIGATLATFIGACTQRPGMPDWAWRIPFLLGAVISFLGYFVRRKIAETPEFVALESENKLSRVPLLKAFISRPRSCLISFMLGGLNGALSYTMFGFLNIYLSRYLGIPMDVAMQLNLVGLFVFMLGAPLMGHLLDLFGHQKFFNFAISGIMIFAIPIFIAISTKNIALIIVGQIFLGLFTASIGGSGHAVMQALFPVADRYSGIAFNFSLGMALLGGMTPIVYVAMIEKHQVNLLFPAFFLMGLTAIFAMILLMNRAFVKNASGSFSLDAK